VPQGEGVESKVANGVLVARALLEKWQ